MNDYHPIFKDYDALTIHRASGYLGAKERMKKTTKEQRKKSSKIASEARWGKLSTKKTE